jgi:hypothetical protein
VRSDLNSPTHGPSRNLTRVSLLSFALLLLWSPARAIAESPVVDDSRDQFTLLPQHLVNRNLIAQLADADQSFRMGRAWDRLALAGDLDIGTQQVYAGGVQGRFHGYYLARTYVAAMPFRGVEANLNVLFFNPSASDPYRTSSQVNAGLALHLYFDAFQIAGHPLQLGVYGTDLDWVTLGQGLLVERTPLEGVMVEARWRGLVLRRMYAGRAFWDDDDLLTTTLSALGGRAQLTHVQWQTDHLATIAQYLSASLAMPLASRFSLAAEAGVRFDKGVSHARGGALLRADVVERRPRFQLHLGYQFRWYQDGFGPRDDLQFPASTFNLPYREDTYVTNSYEYLGISKVYQQWSHTVMFEGRVFLAPRLQLFVDTEAWLRYAAARTDPWVIYTPDGFRAPGHKLLVTYRTGLRLFPWPGLPHRMGATITNKQTHSATDSNTEVLQRFDRGTYFLFTMEAFL